MPWEKFQGQVRAISAPALIIDQESSEPAGQSAPERMAADMQVSFCPPCVVIHDVGHAEIVCLSDMPSTDGAGFPPREAAAHVHVACVEHHTRAISSTALAGLDLHGPALLCSAMPDDAELSPVHHSCTPMFLNDAGRSRICHPGVQAPSAPGPARGCQQAAAGLSAQQGLPCAGLRGHLYSSCDDAGAMGML